MWLITPSGRSGDPGRRTRHGIPAWLAAPIFSPISSLIITLILTLGPHPATASPCPAAITAAELSHHIPAEFLSAIARVESGRPDAATGALVPWPWTVNAQGAGAIFATKAQAIAAVRLLQAQGVRSIDVGCLQVNLEQHPNAFTSLDQAFDPVANAQFAAGFLGSLFGQFHSWPRAAAAYHSQTPTLGTAYQRRVLAQWALPEADDLQDAPPAHPAQIAAALKDPAPARAIAGDAGAPVFTDMMPLRKMGPIAHGVEAHGRSLAAYRLLPVRVRH